MGGTVSSLARIGHCLASAAQAGFRVGVVDGRVRVRRVGGEPTEGRSAGEEAGWRAALRTLDPREVERVLVANVATELDGVDDDLRDAFEERAAIVEHDAGVPRELAERVAWCWCAGPTP
jgi:hypothetical protein